MLKRSFLKIQKYEANDNKQETNTSVRQLTTDNLTNTLYSTQHGNGTAVNFAICYYCVITLFIFHHVFYLNRYWVN